MKMLEDHIVMITGGGSGLGLGLVRYFLRDGARLAVFDVSQAKLDEIAAEFGDSVLTLQGDVRDLSSIRQARAQVEKTFGRLDALVCCHGIFDGNIALDDLDADTLSDLFSEIFSVNVLGHILFVKEFSDMLKQASGSIVLTGSIAAYAADGGGVMYSATKGAISSLVNQMAFELRKKVRVNGVAPAGIANSNLAGPQSIGLENSKQSDIPKDAFLANFRKMALMDELPTPEQHGPIYAFLASHQNQIMTGQTVVVDQGTFNRAIISG